MLLSRRDGRRSAIRRSAPASFTLPIPDDVPVTIAWGTHGRLLPPGQAAVARQRLPQARFVRLPGCGHVPMTDDPALVAQVPLDGSARTVAGDRNLSQPNGTG